MTYFHNLYFFVLLTLSYCWASPAFAQEKLVIEEYETNQRLMKGVISEDIHVTFYLSFFATSSGHSAIYSVKGWYYYDKYEEKIPLVGIYNNGLYLYHFMDKAKNDTILNFRYDDYDKRSFWDAAELYKDMEGYAEKFVFTGRQTNGAFTGTWSGMKNGKPVAFTAKLNTHDLGILEDHCQLKIMAPEEDVYVDLKDFGFRRGNHLWKYKWVDDRLHLLIQYDYPSRAYKLGMCGAGNESGFYALELDENYRVITMERYDLYSCLLSIDYEQIQSPDNLKAYQVRDSNGGVRTISIDKATLKVSIHEQ